MGTSSEKRRRELEHLVTQLESELHEQTSADQRRRELEHLVKQLESELHEQTASDKMELEHLLKQLESDQWEQHEAIPLAPVDPAKARAHVPAAWLHGLEVQTQVILRRPGKRNYHN